jgi:hypothetical protein
MEKPLEEVIPDFLGIRDADVLGIAKRALLHPSRRAR